MNKGFAEEILSFTIIIFSIVILTLFFTSQSVLKEEDVIRSVRGRINDESANLAIQSLYDNRLEEFNKTYMELILDAQLDGGDVTKIEYGMASPKVDVTEVINPLFNRYFGKGEWKLVVKTRKGSVTYGELEKESDYKYVSNIPVPSISLPIKYVEKSWSPELSTTTTTTISYNVTYKNFTKNNIGNVTLYV